MFKVFDEPRPQVHSAKVHLMFPNKAYLILNPVDTFRVDTEGHKIITGYTGELYAMADELDEDMDKYYEAIQYLLKNNLRFGVTNDFPIRDSTLY